MVGYLLYGATCNRRRIRSVILVTTLLGALAGLVWVPLANVSLNASCVPLGSGGHDGGQQTEWGAVIDKLYQNERFMDRPSKDKGLEIVRCR